MRISIVTTLYHSARYVDEFYERVVAAVGSVTDDFEIVFVDDGSPDDSADLVRRHFEKEHEVRLVSLSRNFGHFDAIFAGLAQADGDLVLLLDSDLEEPPELFGGAYARLMGSPPEDPIDVVYCVQDRRKGGMLERFAGAVFYRVFNFLSGVQVPRNAMVARLMTRRYVDALLLHREREKFLIGIMALTGFRQVPMVTQKGHKTSSTYTLGRKVALTLTAIVSFTDRPLTLILILGASISVLAALGGVALAVSVVAFGNHYLAGWTSLVVLLCFFGGAILASVGLIGVYLGRVFVEVKARPTIVKSVEGNRVDPMNAQPLAGARTSE
jgi:putative glycosyltransferase